MHQRTQEKENELSYTVGKIMLSGESWRTAACGTYESAEDAERAAESDSEDSTVMSWVTAEDGTGKTVRIRESVNRENVRSLWDSFGDVAVDDDERMTRYWGDGGDGFAAGTPREDVWHWFEETFHVSVAEDLMCTG